MERFKGEMSEGLQDPSQGTFRSGQQRGESVNNLSRGVERGGGGMGKGKTGQGTEKGQLGG